MAEQLQIKVGADLQQASQAFVKLQKDIETAMKGGEASMNRFVQSYQKLGAASAKTGEAVKKTGKDFTGLSRVIQDLPFGFTAIQNNLTQLVPAAGLAGLAFSALVSGLTFASVGLQSWIRGNSGASKSVGEHLAKVKELQNQMEEYVASLEDVQQARLKGAQNAQEETVRLETLYKASQNSNIPLAERKRLVDELQEQYPRYFANINDEVILAGGAEKAYRRLATAILQTARVRAAEQQIVENRKLELSLEEKLIAGMDEEFKLARNLANFRKKNGLSAEMQGVQGINTKNLQIINEVAKAEGKITKNAAGTTEVYKQLADLRERNLRLANDIQGNIETNGADVLIADDKKVKAAHKKIKEKIQKENELDPPKLRFDVIPYERPTYVGSDKVGRQKNPVLEEILANLNAAEKALTERATNIASTISGVVTPAFQGMFDSLFEGKNVVQGFFAGIAAGLRGLLAKMTQALVQALALKAIFSVLFPGADIARSSVGKIFKGILGFASGGLAFGPTLGLVGEGRGTSRSNPEVIAPLDKLKDYIGGAGGGNVEVYGRLELQGNTLVAAIARANQSQGRKF